MASVPPSTPSAAVSDGLDPDAAAGRRRAFPGVTVLIAGLLLLVAVVWGGFMLIGTLSESHPELTPALIAGTLTGLIVLAIFGMRAADAPPPTPKKRSDPGDGSDGGGGSRRPEPTPPPRSPGPPDPAPLPDAPWDEFDDLRSGWERVPAGHV